MSLVHRKKKKVYVLPEVGQLQHWQGLLSLQINVFKLQTRFPKMDVHVLNQKKKSWFLKFPTLRKQNREISISSSIPQIKIAQGQFKAKQKSFDFCAIVSSCYILIWKTIVSTWASKLNEQIGWVQRKDLSSSHSLHAMYAV